MGTGELSGKEGKVFEKEGGGGGRGNLARTIILFIALR